MLYIFIALLAAIPGFLFGFDAGIVSGALQAIKLEFQLSHLESGLLVGIFPIGALLASCIAGKLSDMIGRQRMFYIIAALFSIGIIGFFFVYSYNGLCVLRFLLGFSIGMSAVVSPLYVAETAPKEMRGKLVTYYPLALVTGIFLAYLVNAVVLEDVSWRMLFLLNLFPALLLLIGNFFLPESPRWLYFKGRKKEAHFVLKKLWPHPHHSKKLDEELALMQSMAEHQNDKGVWKVLFSKKGLTCLVLGVGLFLLQQISGINAIIYYAPTIFSQMNFADTSAQLLATVGLGAVNAVMTVVGLALVEKLGRRLLLIIGFIGTSLSLGFIVIATSFQGPFFEWLAVISVILFIATYACSLNPVPFVLMSEIFPLKIRGPGMSFSAASNWGFNALVVFAFPILLNTIGVSWVFLIFATSCVLGLIFTLRYVPETKGCSLEEIEKHVHSNKPLRFLGR